jgi:hypothetical protein
MMGPGGSGAIPSISAHVIFTTEAVGDQSPGQLDMCAHGGRRFWAEVDFLARWSAVSDAPRVLFELRCASRLSVLVIGHR